MNLPTRRFQALSTANPVIVESDCRFDGPDGEYLGRAVDILQTLDDQIVEPTQCCSSYWDSATIARQIDEAPMIRW